MASFVRRFASNASWQVRTLQLRARSPNLNDYAERWVRLVKQECTSRLIFFGESSLRRALIGLMTKKDVGFATPVHSIHLMRDQNLEDLKVDQQRLHPRGRVA